MIDDDTLVAWQFQKQFKKKVVTDYSSKSVMKKYYRSMKDRVKKGSYKKKGILVELSLDEFSDFWYSHLEQLKKIQDAGFVVSVDRIDSKGNYSLKNIRFLPLHLNRALGKLEQLYSEMKRLHKVLENLKEWV